MKQDKMYNIEFTDEEFKPNPCSFLSQNNFGEYVDSENGKEKSEKLVKAIKSEIDLPLQLHTHYTSGLASMCLIKGVEAGVDMIDTAILNG